MSIMLNWTPVLETLVTGAQHEGQAGSVPVDGFEHPSSAFEEAAKLYGKAVEQYSAAVVLLEKMRISKTSKAEAIRVEMLQFIQTRIEHATSRQAYWIDQARKLREHEGL